MSVITHGKTVEIPGSARQPARAPIASPVPAIVRFLRKAILSTGKFIVLVAEAHAEARIQRAKIEAELYLNRHKHSSKNDDDLPIGRSAPADQRAPAAGRVVRADIAMAKHAVPVVLAMIVFAIIIAAIIAIKLTVWLPMYFH